MTVTTTALEVFTYAGTEVRTSVDDDGEVWFVAADVCKVLDIQNPARAAGELDEDERGLRSTYTPSGEQQMAVVNEAGLYSLIFRSRKPEAKAFRRWVTHEVLPAIRKTGAYYSMPRTYAEALKELASTVEARELAEARAKELEAPAAAWLRLSSAQGDYSMSQAAKILSRDPGIEIGERRLFTALETLRWVYRDKRFGSNGAWAAYQAAIDCGRLVHRTRSHEHPRTGAIVLDAPQVRVTVKGLSDLHKHLGGIQPLAASLTEGAA